MCWLFSKGPSWTAIAGGLVAAVPGQAQVRRKTKLLSMVVFGSHKRWDRWHIILQLAVYTTYQIIYLEGIKQCKCMVILRYFSQNSALLELVI